MTSIRCSVCAALLFLAASFSANAQTPQAPPEPPPQAPPPETPAAPAASGGLHLAMEWGVRFGPSFTSLTSVETLQPEDVGVAKEPTMNFGGFVAFALGPLSLQPEVLYANKGHRIRDKDAPPVTTASGTKEAPADRVILLRYLEIPLLIRASKQTHERTWLYLIGGPAFAFRRNAIVRQVADPGIHTDIDEEITSQNLLFIFGGGLQHKRWLVDARISRGARNVAVVPDPAPVKTNAFSVLMGVRL